MCCRPLRANLSHAPVSLLPHSAFCLGRLVSAKSCSSKPFPGQEEQLRGSRGKKGRFSRPAGGPWDTPNPHPHYWQKCSRNIHESGAGRNKTNIGGSNEIWKASRMRESYRRRSTGTQTTELQYLKLLSLTVCYKYILWTTWVAKVWHGVESKVVADSRQDKENANMTQTSVRSSPLQSESADQICLLFEFKKVLHHHQWRRGNMTYWHQHWHRHWYQHWHRHWHTAQYMVLVVSCFRYF